MASITITFQTIGPDGGQGGPTWRMKVDNPGVRNIATVDVEPGDVDGVLMEVHRFVPPEARERFERDVAGMHRQLRSQIEQATDRAVRQLAACRQYGALFVGE